MTPHSASLRILVVDDDPISAAILQAHLTEAGHEVCGADSAAGAMYALEHSIIHIVIADWIMPDVSGLDLCRWVRSRPLPCAPHFVILTVFSDKERLVEAFHAGADDFLSKPFHEAELMARLRAWTRLVSLQEELAARNEDAQRLTTQLVILNQKLAELAAHDELTGLPNRREALRRLEENAALACRYAHPFTIALVDIDHFKQFNDSYGHTAGDSVLKHVANSLNDSSRAADNFFRIGGDEFLVILPREPLDSALAWSTRFQESLAAHPLIHNGAPLPITCSIGLAQCPRTGATADEFLDMADRALYTAKREGRNTTRHSPLARS